MKTLRYTPFLLPLVLLTTLFTARSFAQGGGCSSLNLSLEQIDACTYRLYFNNQAADCFQQMTLLIDSGEFGSWSPNTAGGWNVVPTSATELEVSHDNGLFPAGAGYILDVQIDLTASATLTVLYYYDCPLGEGCAADFAVTGCPDPQDASIIGVKYKECGILPFSNQTPLAGWTIQLFDQDDNLLAEDVTDSTGAYGFYDLLGGVYTVREVQQPGWTPKVPASGEYLIDLDPSEQRNVNYGNCPPTPPPCACPAGTQPGAANLVQNGDFSGSGGFSSGYAQNNNNPPLQPGQYWIGSNPSAINTGFSACGDHTGGGNMLVVNGGPSPSTPFWCQTIAVTPNTTYIFEAWTASLTSASTANLSLFVIINSLNVQYEVGRIFPSGTPCDWQRWCETWQTGNYTSITLCLYDLNPTAAGNDFAIDDISFRKCVNPIAHVTGVVYRTCDSVPYTDQPVLAGWTVQLLDTMENLIAEQVTDSSGAYAFSDLPPGWYVVKAAKPPTWTPNFPLSGKTTVELDGGEEVVENFGFCPECSCDSIEVIPYLIQGPSDTALYQLGIFNQSPYCFSFIEIELDSVGVFVGWDSLQPGWTVEFLNPKLIQLHWVEPQLPAGFSSPVWLKAKGEGEQKLMVTTFRDDGAGCVRGFENPVPTPLDVCCFNPGVYNLIPNGSFTQGNTGFSSAYNSNCNTNQPNRYCITTSPSSANNNFANCGDYTTGNGPMMVVNGNGPLNNGHPFWRVTNIPVQPNTYYKFIFHYTPLSSQNKPTLWVSIGGGSTDLHVSTGGVNGDVCSWLGMCVYNWYNATGTTATLQLIDLTTNIQGNDFAIDDIWFFPCPLPCSVSANIVSTDCNQVDLQAIGTGPGPITYQWCDNQVGDMVTQTLPCGPFSCTVTATCLGGGTATATVFGNLGESIDPVANCQLPYSVDLGSNCTGPVTVAMVDDLSTDNCPVGITKTVSPAVLVACQDNPITLTVEDWCGNTSTCTTNIYATESEPPMALCIPGMSIDLGLDCALNVTPALIDAGSTDNCQIASLSVDPILISCEDATVTLTVTDWCGNISTCTTGIQALEFVPPAITCPFGISANCNINVDPSFAGEPTATDNCTADIKITYSYSDLIFGTIDCDDYIERTWVAQDLCGNTSSCVQVISVKDNIPPVITNCPTSQTVGMDAGQCFYTYTPPNLSVTDNCDPSPTLSCTYEEPSGTIWPLTGGVQLTKGVSTIRCTATDDCGNVSDLCTYTLHVTDMEQPTLSCPQNVTVQSVYNAAGLCEAVVNNLAPTVTDNCPIMSLDYLVSPSGVMGQNDASGTLFEGVSTVTYTVLDCGGFTKTCSFTVSVLCPPCVPVSGAPCAVAQNLTVDCIPGVFGQYDFSFEVLNQSGFNADRIELTAVTPFGAVTQTVFNVNVANNGTSGPLTTTLNGVPGATVCFKIVLQRTAPNGVVLECCETAQICLTLPECPGPCNCAGADNLNFTFTGITPNVSWPGPVAATCGNTAPVILPCIPYGETPFAFHGVVHCDADDCLFNTIDYEVTDPAGVVVLPGGSLPLAVIGQDGYFDIYNLSANSLVPGVTYTLTLTWYCGGKICKCEVKFQTSVCDCHCISPVTNVAISSGTLTLSAPCGSTLFQGIPCPPAGNFVKITGKFGCIGAECLPGKIVRYTLTGPNGPVTTGGVLATPYFSISLLPQLMYAVGQYTITMTGECNGQPCTPCTFSFFHQCPEPCPCPDATFNNRVDQGFTVASTGTACKACFIPKQLGPCETVEWFVNGVGPIGTPTVGNAPFCHTFSSTATYQITMKVTRQKTDGTFCAMRSKTLNIKILCDPSNLPCSADVVSNPGFDVGPAAGGLNSGGAAPGWTGAFGDPMLQAGSGASDGWSIMLSGNRDAADVLSRESAFCWVKDTGTIALRLQVWGINHIAATGGQKPGEALTLRLYRGAAPNPLTDSCDGVNCLELVSMMPFAPDSGDWFTLEIPYDLTAWAAADSCGNPVPDPQGVLVRPVVYVTNWLGSESGDAAETRSMILIDNFCFDGQLVGVKDPASKGRIRIFPNPNAGDFTVELPSPAARDMRLRVVSLTGQVLLEKQTETGSARQTVEAGDLPAGLYFVQVVSEGRVLAVGKFVKE